jgi:tripartite ATP-independent transporter DctM subunit
MINTVAIALLLGVFITLVLIRVPITFALGLSAITTALYLHLPLLAVMQQMVKGISSFSLITIPFFILAGEIMGQGGISKRLVDFTRVLVGRLRGGLAMVDVVACLFFGGLSGSSVADAAAVGSIMIPMMEQDGYDTDFATSVTIVSATQGVLVPPSHNMIIYSLMAGGISIGSLFMAGIIPGVFLGLCIMLFSYVISVKRKYPKGKKLDLRTKFRMLKDGILGLMTAVIIMGGILSGICTATESAALATVYAFIITFFVYKDIPLSKMGLILRKTLKTISMVMPLIATSAAFGWMIALVRLPELVTNGLTTITTNKILIFLIVNLILFLMHFLMDMAPIIVVATPILLPVVEKFGMSPVQFGVIMMLNLGIGLLMPPVGSTLFIGCSIGKISIEKMVKALLPFYALLIVVLLVITFVPQISLFLPSLMK